MPAASVTTNTTPTTAAIHTTVVTATRIAALATNLNSRSRNIATDSVLYNGRASDSLVLLDIERAASTMAEAAAAAASNAKHHTSRDSRGAVAAPGTAAGSAQRDGHLFRGCGTWVVQTTAMSHLQLLSFLWSAASSSAHVVSRSCANNPPTPKLSLIAVLVCSSTPSPPACHSLFRIATGETVLKTKSQSVSVDVSHYTLHRCDVLRP